MTKISSTCSFESNRFIGKLFVLERNIWNHIGVQFIYLYASLQSGPGNEGNKGVLCIPQSSSVTGASPSDCLVSYLGHFLEESYPCAGRSRCILQPQPTGPDFGISNPQRLICHKTKRESKPYKCISIVVNKEYLILNKFTPMDPNS